MIAFSLIVNVALLLALDADAAAAPKAEILGVWKGLSTCTKVEGNEFCQDEMIIYSFVDVAGQPATVGLKAARIVDGTLRRAYDLYFTYRPEAREWTSEFARDTSRGLWKYVVAGDGLTGTAVMLPDHKVVRNVIAKRTTKDQVLAP